MLAAVIATAAVTLLLFPLPSHCRPTRALTTENQPRQINHDSETSPSPASHNLCDSPIQTFHLALPVLNKRVTKSSKSASLSTSQPLKITSTRNSAASRPPVVPTSPSVPTTPSSWRLPQLFTSVTAFLLDIDQLGYWGFGSDNAGVVQKVPANAYTAGRSDGQNDLPALSALYPKGSYSPGNTPQGGIGFYASPLPVAAAGNLSLSYSVFFPKEFIFVKGGKLPGLFGGKQGCSGGDAASDCFSSRIMFRKGGMGELYLYAPRAKQVPALCTLKPFSYCNSVDGMSIGRGSWTFRTGQWTTIRQDIWLNTPGIPNGGFNIWINGQLVLTSSSVYLREGSGFGNFASAPPFLLFDYDNLPDDIIIPNGGLLTLPTTLFSTAIPAPTMHDVDNRLMRRLGEPMVRDGHGRWSKQAVAPPFTFSGIMFHTFFGGSSTSWASPKVQRTYFNNLSMQINS